MASVAQRFTAAAGRAKRGERSIPVIADGGERAWVVLVSFPADPRVGDTFFFRGLQWSIVRSQDSIRGFVARPRPTRISDN